MTIELAEFLDGLKPGDTVEQVVSKTWGPSRVEQLTVAKRTATQIVMTNGTRYRAKDGMVIGHSVYGKLRLPPTMERKQEIKDEIEHSNIAHVVRDTNWRGLSLDKLRRIKAILEEKQDDE